MFAIWVFFILLSAMNKIEDIFQCLKDKIMRDVTEKNFNHAQKEMYIYLLYQNHWYLNSGAPLVPGSLTCALAELKSITFKKSMRILTNLKRVIHFSLCKRFFIENIGACNKIKKRCQIEICQVEQSLSIQNKILTMFVWSPFLNKESLALF